MNNHATNTIVTPCLLHMSTEELIGAIKDDHSTPAFRKSCALELFERGKVEGRYTQFLQERKQFAEMIPSSRHF